MAYTDPDQLLARAAKADEKRQAMQSIMSEVYRYCMPERDNWNSYGTGADRTTWIYDSAGVASTSRFANRLQGTVFPTGQRWAKLALPPEMETGSEDSKQVAADLDRATQVVFRHVHASNFDAEINPFCHDMAAGVAALLVENGRLTQKRSNAPLLRCLAVPPARLSFDEGPWGTVEGIFFNQVMPGRLVQRHYPDAKLPQQVKAAIDAKPEADINMLQATYYDAKSMKWCFEVLLKDEKEYIVTRKYRTNPWIITRWTRVPGETHGRGPLLQALPDIRVANKLMELMLVSGSFDATPTFTAVDDGVLNPDVVEIVPGEVIPVRSNGGPMGPSLQAVLRPGSLQFSDALLDRMHTRIRQLLFDNPLPPEVQAGLTATEIVERIRLFQQDSGSFGRLHQDAVSPLMLRFVDILEEAGEFKPAMFGGNMGDLFKALRDNILTTRVISPIARAQDQADVQSVMSMVSGAAALGEFGGRMLQAGVDPEKAGRFVAVRTGIPAELIPTEEETAGAMRAAQKAAENQTMLTSPVVAQGVGALASAAANGAQSAQPAQPAQ